MSRVVSRSELREIILRGMQGRWWWDDGNDPRHLPILARGAYTLPLTARVPRILNWSQIDGLTREAPQFVCPEFAMGLMFDFRLYGRFPWLELEAPYAAGMWHSVHAGNWVVTADEKLWFLEPQEDWMMEPSNDPEARPGHFRHWFFYG